jgi:hypothetical protein
VAAMSGYWTPSSAVSGYRTPSPAAGWGGWLPSRRGWAHYAAGSCLTIPGWPAGGLSGYRHRLQYGFKASGTPRHRSCQTYLMTERGEDDRVRAISLELAACRKRGIERVDLRSHNQNPVQTPELDRLADEYLKSRPQRVQGRPGRLKYLLRDALEAFKVMDGADAELVRALFFGDSQHRVTKSAGELLDVARRQYEAANEVRFRQVRHEAFDSFAEYLPRFVANNSYQIT